MSVSIMPYVLKGDTWRWPCSLNDKFNRYLYGEISDDHEPRDNPYYDPRFDINMSNRNASLVLAAIGVDSENDPPMPIDQVHERIVNRLRRVIGKKSKGFDTTDTQEQGHARFIDFGIPDGYIEQRLHQIQVLIEASREHGVTHIGWT